MKKINVVMAIITIACLGFEMALGEAYRLQHISLMLTSMLGIASVTVQTLAACKIVS